MFTGESSLPFSGGVMIAGLAYAGICAFVLGPLYGQRTIEKMNWSGQCEGYIRADVAEAEPETPIVPRLSCNALFGMFGPDGKAFCQVHGQTIENNPINQSLEAAERAKQAAQKKRMEYAVSRSGSRCECATTTTLETRRIPLAIAAGTALVVVPQSATAKSLESDLRSSLNSAACAMKG